MFLERLNYNGKTGSTLKNVYGHGDATAIWLWRKNKGVALNPARQMEHPVRVGRILPDEGRGGRNEPSGAVQSEF